MVPQEIGSGKFCAGIFPECAGHVYLKLQTDATDLAGVVATICTLIEGLLQQL